ncbi:hypothetical protein WG902_21975 [Ramlibacter sp. PS3R-8]|uniref:hypothetical protein n=1 Tax=Ramlibacter sp. PS3R-8 TaxID=3133437 RepID=UPI00309A2BC4
MFIGHFAVGFAAKRIAPRLSLGTAFMAAQFIDLLWPTLLLLGLESVRIAPGATAVTPFVFEHYPFSHSLVAVLGWAVLLGVGVGAARRSARVGGVVAALVLSHWFLDAIVHAPDLPLAPGFETLVGFGLWNSLSATLAVEVPLFAIGVWLYASSTRATDRTGRFALIGLVAFLAVIYVGNLFGPPPSSVRDIAVLGHAQWLLVLWGYWVDAHRRAVEAREPMPIQPLPASRSSS